MNKLYAFLLGSCVSCVAIAQPAGWTYTQVFQVTNNVAATVTDYQLSFTFDSQTLIGLGQMNANGDDIRFGSDCNGTTMYNYWIESGINTPSTLVWVKIPSMPASGTVQLFMYYGNAAAPAASAVMGTFIGPHSSTDSVASGGAGGVGDSQRGFRFSPNEDVLVTAFGKREPTGTTRYVTLFNFATQAIISQQQVSGPAAQYSYSNIASPIWLTTGTQYLLELFQGTSDGYYFGTSSQIGQHLTYYDMRYCNGCTQNTFPTNTLTNYQYGYPDLWYFTKQTIAAAPTVTTAGPLTSTSSVNSTICEGDSVAVSITPTGGATPYSYSWSPSTGIGNPFAGSTMASPPSTQAYTVTVTDACGSTSTGTGTINVNALPAVIAGVSTDSVCSGGAFTPLGGGASTYAWSGGLTDNVAFTPVSTDTYTVTGTDGNGCSATATAIVEVLALPSVVANTTSASVCAGDSIVLSGSGAATYTWDNGATDNMQHIPAASAMYHVTGTDMYGCVNWDSIMITVNPLPVVAMSGPSLVCDMDAAFTLVGTPAGGTFSGPGVTGNQFDPAAATAGTHTLVYAYTDGNNCTGYDSISVTVDLCLSIAGAANNGVEVYPNPFSNQLIINLNETAHIQMVNTLGEVVFEQKLNAGRNEISTADYPNGVYFLGCTSSSGTTTLKLVKNK